MSEYSQQAHGTRSTHLTIQDIRISVPLDSHFDICGITGGDLWLRHEEGRSDLSVEQGVQPLPLLRLASILGNHLHVAGIRGSTVDRLFTVSNTYLGLETRVQLTQRYS